MTRILKDDSYINLNQGEGIAYDEERKTNLGKAFIPSSKRKIHVDEEATAEHAWAYAMP